jgi:hypothetical protein
MDILLRKKNVGGGAAGKRSLGRPALRTVSPALLLAKQETAKRSNALLFSKTPHSLQHNSKLISRQVL